MSMAQVYELMPPPGRMRGIERIPYQAMSIPLDKARTDFEIELPILADTITVMNLVPSSANVSIRLNYKDDASIVITGIGQHLETFSRIPETMPIKIHKLFITNDANPGGHLDLVLGGELGLHVSPGQTVAVQNFDTQLGYVEDIRNQLLNSITNILLGSNKLSDPLVQTSTPLVASGSWTSAWVSIDSYGKLVGTIYTDQDGSFEIQQSNDGTNIDAAETHSYTAGTYQGYYTDVVAPYARLIVTNTATTDETVLRALMRGRVI